MKRHFVWILAASMLIKLLSLASISLAEDGKWIRKTDMPTARWGLSTCAVNGKIYAIGGMVGDAVAGSKAVSTVEKYDPATDRWTEKADMPTARGCISASVVNGKIYVFGGWDFATASMVEEFDPATNRWTKKASIPSKRTYFSTCTVNGKIYAIGGYDGNEKTPMVEEYNPATNRWAKKADMPTARAYLSTSAVNGKIYAIGGCGPGAPTSAVEEYNPATDTWVRKDFMPPNGVDALSTSVVNGKIYVVGGSFIEDLPTVKEYDPVMDRWTEKADMTTARRWLSTSVVNGKIYAIGGCAGQTILSTVEVYDTGFAVEAKGKLSISWSNLKVGY